MWYTKYGLFPKVDFLSEPCGVVNKSLCFFGFIFRGVGVGVGWGGI